MLLPHATESYIKKPRKYPLPVARKAGRASVFSFHPVPILRPNRWKHLQDPGFSRGLDLRTGRYNSFLNAVFVGRVRVNLGGIYMELFGRTFVLCCDRCGFVDFKKNYISCLIKFLERIIR